MASSDAQRRVVPAGAAAAPPAMIAQARIATSRPSLQTIMQDAQKLLEANEAAAKQELAQLQLKVRAQETELAGQRTALAAANTAALNSKKLAEEMVICILLLVACCLLCAHCSDLCRASSCSRSKRRRLLPVKCCSRSRRRCSLRRLLLV